MARTVSLKKLIWETVTSHKFETWLVGIKGDEYCVGYVKGSESACQRAKEKYTDGSVWSLSKVTFDNYSDAKYISTPIPFRVDLGKSTLTLLSGDSAPEVAEHAVLPRSVADVKRITTTRGTDVIAVLKEVSKERHQTKKSGEDVADITLVDNSNATAGSLAAITVSVFGTSKLNTLSGEVVNLMAFFNLSVDCSGQGKVLSHYAGELVEPAPECEKASTLRKKARELRDATNLEMLSTAYTPTH